MEDFRKMRWHLNIFKTRLTLFNVITRQIGENNATLRYIQLRWSLAWLWLGTINSSHGKFTMWKHNGRLFSQVIPLSSIIINAPHIIGSIKWTIERIYNKLGKILVIQKERSKRIRCLKQKNLLSIKQKNDNKWRRLEYEYTFIYIYPLEHIYTRNWNKRSSQMTALQSIVKLNAETYCYDWGNIQSPIGQFE